MQSYSYHSAKSFCNASKYRLWRLPILMIGLFSIGHVYAGTSESALFIDEKGNVGINTAQPQGFQVQLPESSKPPAPNPGVTMSGGKEGNASMELRNKGTGTPYIDFSQNTTADYDARIRLTEPESWLLKALQSKRNRLKPRRGFRWPPFKTL